MLNLLKYLKPKDWLLLVISFGLIVVQVWLELKMPDYTANLTNLVQSGDTTIAAIWHNGGLMLACALGSLISAIICSILISKVASSFSMILREKLFRKISDFSQSEMKQFSIPSLITRTTNDVVQLQNFMAMGVQLLFKAPLMAIWGIIKISSTNIEWTSAVLISVIIIVICVSILISICLPRFRKIQKLTDDINNVTRENVSGVSVVRAFNAEHYQEQKFEVVNQNITDNNLYTARAMGILMPLMTLVMHGLNLAIYWIAALLINNIVLASPEAMTDRIAIVGNMVAFSQYAMQIVMSFMMLIVVFVLLPRTLVSAKRITQVLHTNSTITSPAIGHSTRTTGSIQFKNVSFAYKDSNQGEMALQNIAFKVTKGQTLAIIGATGSAKTTLINLIPRFYDVTQGEILVDGINVKDYNLTELRNKIAIASQQAVLFKGTVLDNITYGSATYNEERVQNAINISQSQFVLKLKNGIHSPVAQGGTNFSGGQKQRLSIARAIYKDAEILIFDDSFSALDYKTDMLIRKGIHQQLDDKTIIIVAQRIGTIKDADQIIVLDQGKMVGIGTHSQLMQNCKIYQEIALSQLSKEEL